MNLVNRVGATTDYNRASFWASDSAPNGSDDTTSVGIVVTRRLHSRSLPGPRSRNGIRSSDEHFVLLALLNLWGSRLGTPDESDAFVQRFEEVATDATSWELLEEEISGIRGVVAVSRLRPELFRVVFDVSPGALPRRQPRFAFLDRRESQDDE